MDFVWSPWRYTYVSSAKDSGACPFCLENSPIDPVNDDERLVLYRGVHTFVIMNLYPYTSGHLLVAPYRHIGSLTDAQSDEMAELTYLAQRSVGILERTYRPEGFNIGMNLGECAGAGVREHIHMHVVPRWCGDVNFMTSTAETRVLPDDLSASFNRLKPLFS